MARSERQERDMADDSGAKMAQVERHAVATRRDSMFTAFTQTLLAINGGAIVAVGGMAQALVKQQAWASYRLFALWSLGLFITGVVCATLIFYSRMVQLNNLWDGDSKFSQLAGMAGSVCATIALLAFLVGSTISAVGIARI
jgi:hypothetical protein